MKVRSPDGKRVYNVPDGATDEQIEEFITGEELARSMDLPTRSGGVIEPPDPGVKGAPVAAPGSPPLSDLLPPGLAIGGGIAGGMVAGPPGAAVGAGVGGFMGEAIRRYLQGETPDVMEAAGTGIMSGLTEGAGQAVMGAVRGGAFSRGYQSPASTRFRALAEREGIVTSPAEQAGSQVLGQIEAFPFRVPFGSQRMVDLKARELASMETAVNRPAYGGAAPAPSARGTRMQADLEAAEAAARARGSGFYRDVAKLAGKEEFQTPAFRQAIDAALERQQRLAGLGPAGEKRFATAGDTALKNPEYTEVAGALLGNPQWVAYRDAIASQTGASKDDILAQALATMGVQRDRGIIYESAHELQSLLGAAIRSSKSDFASLRLRELRDGLTADIEAWATAKGGPLGKGLKDAARFYRDEIGGVFDEQSLVRQMLQAKPEEVVGMVRTVTDARKLRQALDSVAKTRPDALPEMRRAFMQNVIDKSLDGPTQAFSPERFLTQLSKYTPEARLAILGRAEDKHVNEIAEVLRHQLRIGRSGLNPSETARGILGSEQLYGIVRFGATATAGAASVAAGAAAGGMPGGALAAGAVLVTPAALSRLLTSEKGQRWLLEGLKISPKVEHAARVAEQIALHGALQATETDRGTRRLIMRPNEVLTGPVRVDPQKVLQGQIGPGGPGR